MKETKPWKGYIGVSVQVQVSDSENTLLSYKPLFRKMLKQHLPGKEALFCFLQMLEFRLLYSNSNHPSLIIWVPAQMMTSQKSNPL